MSGLDVNVFHALIVMWLVIIVSQLWGARLIRKERDYHPSYKLLKNVLGGVMIFSMVSFYTGLRGSAIANVGFLAFLSLGSIIEFQHILRRNRRSFYMTVRTRIGLAHFSGPDEVNYILSQAAGIIRHTKTDANVRREQASIEEILEALDLPPADEWHASLREQMRRRREKMSVLGIEAEEVHQFNREIEVSRGGDETGGW